MIDKQSLKGAKFGRRPYLSVFLIIALLTIMMRELHPFVQPVMDLTNVALLYLLLVLFTAIRWGRGPSIFAALVAVFCFDVFFVPPQLSVTVADLRYLFVFAVFLLVAIITGTLASRLGHQAESARRREARTASLYALSQRMAAETDLQTLLQTVVTTVASAVDGNAVLYMPDAAGDVAVQASATPDASKRFGELEQAAASWAHEHGQVAGRGTKFFSQSNGWFVPLVSEERKTGSLGVMPATPERDLSPEQRKLIEAFANLASIAIARLQLAMDVQKAKQAEESEKLRTALFNSVSHDLRTPLSSITGAVTSLQEEDDIYSREDKMTLIQTIREGATQLNHLVGNLLDTARLESGMLQPNKDWCDIQDIIGVARRRAHNVLRDRQLVINMSSELPLVQADFSLIEQVIVNLFYNAVKYSFPGSEITLSVRTDNGQLSVAVCDKGPGISKEDRERVFDKFYRLHSPEHVLGTGLGLSICKGFVEAHGGRIWVEAGHKSGSMFIFTLPLDEQPAIEEPMRMGGGDNNH